MPARISVELQGNGPPTSDANGRRIFHLLLGVTVIEAGFQAAKQVADPGVQKRPK